MASYDKSTGIYTMTISEAASYLKGLPQNTKETPYKVNITGIDLSNRGIAGVLTRLMGKRSSEASPQRFLDLSNTQISYISKASLYCLFVDGFFLVASPFITSGGWGSMVRTFYGCENLTTITNIPEGVTNMGGAFYGCTNLTTIPNIPNGVTNMNEAFEGCRNLTTISNIPDGVTSMGMAFYGCTNLTTIPNIPTSVTSMYEAFDGCRSLEIINIGWQPIDFSKVEMTDCFRFCESLKKFTYNVESEENDKWTLYWFKRSGNNIIIKRYSVDTNAFIDTHTISLDDDTTYELDLFSKSDELLIDSIDGITDQQIKSLLENRLEFGDKYSLDPSKKWLVIWADNPDNVRSNCFVTQRELQSLKEKLKAHHPDLF